MFGYSVSFLNDTLLVGAPKVNASRFDDIIEPGGVYSCSLSDSGSADGCSLLQIDDSPNNIGKAAILIDIISVISANTNMLNELLIIYYNYINVIFSYSSFWN